ncbi:hypothetical protein [Streptomyces roseicoloratus]|uniref:hypothetical protein n=1 Tax=Streptomyces roseicoloratus TaxID=2508722 RepID=UPI001009F637|nr:hypothetical protein [Streptomyces roseicoloratus]
MNEPRDGRLVAKLAGRHRGHHPAYTEVEGTIMPRTRKTPAQLAVEAAVTVRELNHVTTRVNAYPYPGDVDDTVQGLRILAGRLPQAISQGGTALARLAEGGNVRLDAMSPGGSLDEHMKDTLAAAADATQAAAELENALKRLGGYTCHLAFAEPQETGA